MNKIEALEKTIYNLENDVYEYKWDESDKCNCGVLAKTLLGGKTAQECGYHQSPKLGDYGVFSRNAYCMTTDLPLPTVFNVLKDTGFTHEDLMNLEYFGNEKIALKLGKEISYRDGHPFGYKSDTFNDKKLLIKYLKAWVEILKEEQPIIETPPTEEPKIKEIIRYVSVPQSITEQSKELILS
jgi:hypothetical protein